MKLANHLREVGTPHKCALAVGGMEKASGLTAFLEGPITNDLAREGSWRGLIEGFPNSILFGEQFLIMTLDDGRAGKIQIQSSADGAAIFSGIGILAIPLTPEEEEDEILGILRDIETNNA